MGEIEHSLTLTPDELQCLVCAMAGNFPDRFKPIRMDLLRKLAKARRTDTRGAVEALRQVVDTWDNPAPAARQDVRYQQCVRLARATLDRLGGQ